MSKLLALDQSSQVTGYTILDDGKIVKVSHFECTGDLGDRLVKLRNKVIILIEEYDIEEIVFEDIQLQDVNGNKETGIKTFKVLAEVYGVIHQLLDEKKIPYQVVPSVTWKSTLGIKGKNRQEQKKNAQLWVINTYNQKPTQDECDAICIGEHIIRHNGENAGFDWAD